jgi:hypothetical protein
MALLGYVVRTAAMGAFIVMGGEGKEVDAGEYCSFPTSFNLWKCDFLDLKVSRPVEDICKDCYAFANHHRYLANYTMGWDNDDDNSNSNSKHSNDGRSNDDDNNDGSNNVSDVGAHPMRDVDLNRPEVLSKKPDKESKLMLLQAAVHIKMARAQRALY